MKHKQGTNYHETGRPHQCQCSIDCNFKSLPGEAFCEKHMNNCNRKSPLTGAEPDWHPSLWNTIYSFFKTHNCYSYSMNVRDPKQMSRCRKKGCSVGAHQPGAASGYRPFSNDMPKTCPNLLSRIFGDNPLVTVIDFESQCPPNFSKISLIGDQSDDYHFVRWDSNGYCSHKPGTGKVINFDAYGHKIYDPKLANYNYASLKNGNNLNHDIFCSYLCVPRNKALRLKPSSGGSRSKTFRSRAKPVWKSLSARARPFRTAKTRRRSRG